MQRQTYLYRDPGDDDHPLGVRSVRPLNSVEHHVHRLTLTVQQHELLPVPDLRGGSGEKLWARSYRRTYEPVNHPGVPDRGDPCLQIVGERLDIGAGEQLRVEFRGVVVQLRDSGTVGHIVEEDHGLHRIRSALQNSQKVREQLVVGVNLAERMQPRTPVRAGDLHKIRIILENCRRTPLLELDHNERREAGRRTDTGDHGVHPSGAQRQLVLQQDIDIPQARVPENLRQFGNTVLPGTALGR